MGSDRQRHNLGTLRDLLLSAFTPQDLRRFCQDRPLLKPIVLQFSPDHGLTDLVDRVITYCEKQCLLDTLLDEIQKENPTQYARFEPCLVLPARASDGMPYRGLQPFEEEHAAFFFGRHAMIAQLVDFVRDHPFVGVVGPSGSGKSSLVRAGLVPALHSRRPDTLLGSGDWAVCLFRPGSEPLRALAAPLVDLLEPDAGEVTRLAEARSLAQALAEGSIPLAGVAARIRANQPAVPRLLLVVDQFEEVFTECRDAPQRQSFIGTLLKTGPDVSVVLTLRADFYGHLLADPRLAEAASAGLFIVLSMSRDELRTAIEQPAFKCGGAFEAGLVERILDDVEGQPGSLPLLEFALTELWARATSQGLLTHAAYGAIGEVQGAIARRAEAVYEALSAQGCAHAVRGVFLRLAHSGAGMEGTRRRAAVPDLATPGMPAAEVEAVVKRLADARLVVTTQDTLTGIPTVEVSHEALIHGWSRLRTWLDEDRAFGLWRDKIAAARRAWLDTAQDEGALLRGVPLSEAEGWLAGRGDDLNEGERAYIQAGLALRELDAAERREQQRKEAQLAAEHRAARRLRRLAAALASLFIVAVGLAGLAASFWNSASDQRDLAEAARTQADALKLAFASLSQLDTNQELALLLGVEAARAVPSFEADCALRAWSVHPGSSVVLLRGHTGPLQDAAWDGEGRHIVTASRDGTARVWDAETGQELAVLSGHEDVVWFAAWDGEGRRIVTASEDGTARVWDAATGQELVVLSGHENGVKYAAWDVEGQHIVTASEDGTARVWDAATGQELAVLRGHKNGVEHAAWDGQGRHIVTASWDGTARVWDAGNGEELAVLSGHEDMVWFAAWDGEGRRIVTASRDGTARVWDAETGQELAVLRGHEDEVWFAAWDGEGRRIATASTDGTARVWDARTGQELAVLHGHEYVVYNAAWDGEGRRIVTAGADGTARVWDAETGQELSALSGHDGAVTHAEWDSEGRRVVTAGWDGTARVWDAATGREPAVLRGHKGAVYNAAWDGEGRRVVTASEDGTARVWDAETGQELTVLRGHEGAVTRAAWDGEGRRIVTAGEDGTARVWDAATGQELVQLRGHEDRLYHAAWDGEGRRIVTASWDGTARVWDSGTGQELAVLRGHQNGVVYAAWDGEGRHIVTASWDGTARVWDAGTGEELVVLSGHEDAVWFAAWDGEGRRIVTAGADGTARIWDARTGQELAVLRGHQGRVRSAAWDGEGRRIVTASWDGTARVWDAGTAQELVVLRGHEGLVNDAEWDGEGQHIVTASYDHTARIWDANTGQELAVLRGHEGSLVYVEWDGKGRRIVTASGDGTVRIYHARIEDLVALACERAVRNMSANEWARYMGSQLYRETCPGKPVPGKDF